MEKSNQKKKKPKVSKGSKGGQVPAGLSKWLKHVSEVRGKHPEKSYKECLKLAADSYKK